TGDAGVHLVAFLITQKFRWLFREQPKNDYAIDSHVEPVDGEPSGRLLGLPIKSGIPLQPLTEEPEHG
ncbi:MAG: DUF4365 domain-containing protein, partial [Pseudonocardiaceae bacterium]